MIQIVPIFLQGSRASVQWDCHSQGFNPSVLRTHGRPIVLAQGLELRMTAQGGAVLV